MKWTNCENSDDCCVYMVFISMFVSNKLLLDASQTSRTNRQQHSHVAELTQSSASFCREISSNIKTEEFYFIFKHNLHHFRYTNQNLCKTECLIAGIKLKQMAKSAYYTAAE